MRAFEFITEETAIQIQYGRGLKVPKGVRRADYINDKHARRKAWRVRMAQEKQTVDMEWAKRLSDKHAKLRLQKLWKQKQEEYEEAVRNSDVANYLYRIQ